MNESQISVRYAKALFESASERKILDKVYGDMELLSDTCKLEEFKYLLEVPTLTVSQKKTLVDSIFKAHISDATAAMISLVIKNKREVFFPGIARNFRALYRKTKGISSATLVTAQPVDDKAMEGVKSLIAKAYDSDVELSSAVNPDVIGGFVLTIEDLQYDASVSSSLKKIKKQLLQTSIENK
jgi:F-type H+-transporting ATPase subunit delta